MARAPYMARESYPEINLLGISNISWRGKSGPVDPPHPKGAVRVLGRL